VTHDEFLKLLFKTLFNHYNVFHIVELSMRSCIHTPKCSLFDVIIKITIE
jgi:hypothetical protein